MIKLQKHPLTCRLSALASAARHLRDVRIAASEPLEARDAEQVRIVTVDAVDDHGLHRLVAGGQVGACQGREPLPMLVAGDKVRRLAGG